MAQEEKRRLRRLYAAAPPDPAADAAIARRVLALPECAAAGRVLCFVGTAGEIDTLPLLRGLLAAGKAVFVPVSFPGGAMRFRRLLAPEELTQRDCFGIPVPPAGREETGPECPALCLTPGVCFGRDGSRLGRGGGFYDRFFSRFSGVAVGLCREERLLDTVPTERHDRPMDLVVTQRSVVRGERYGGR